MVFSFGLTNIWCLNITLYKFLHNKYQLNHLLVLKNVSRSIDVYPCFVDVTYLRSQEALVRSSYQTKS